MAVPTDLVAARAAPDEHRDVLLARAGVLARAGTAQTPAETFSAVVFMLGDERYALDTTVVLQVGVLRELTPLPGARAPLHGVTQWRGDVLTVLDLRSVLGASLRGITDLGRLVVVEGAGRTFGILAERLVGITEIDAARIQPLPHDDAAARSLLRGVTDDAVFVVDEEALLAGYGTSAGTR
ncbi:MAG TPA: chemotaxis protein CheW [Longimicrobiales bacterium]|nr:chemotaxis protein CheW [Longimicrobiales bacterium]